MSQRAFDEKFGADFLATVPAGPGVYRYLDRERTVIYVGKAKNLKRRLQGYRNASRKKLHRKMLRIVKQASFLSYESVSSEAEALLLENRLIQELKPRLNVEGAFSFLYPALGVGEHDRRTMLCFTTEPAHYQSLHLSWYGTYRSRLRTKAAFEALVALLALIGHLEKRSALPSLPTRRGSRLVGLRQVPLDLSESLPWFLAGEDPSFLQVLAVLLLQKPRARREADQVEAKLQALRCFFQQDAQKLNQALRRLGRPGSYISATDRDALMIQARFDRVEQGA